MLLCQNVLFLLILYWIRYENVWDRVVITKSLFGNSWINKDIIIKFCIILIQNMCLKKKKI